MSGPTRKNYFGNGHDERYVNVSNIAGYVTIESLSGMLGVASGTVRDLISGGRKGERPQLGVKIGNTWMVPIDKAEDLIHKRLNPGG